MIEEEFFREVKNAREQAKHERKTYDQIIEEYAKLVESGKCKIGGLYE